MCYAGGAGFGGYGGYGGYVRRARFYDFDMNIARITTYKRLEYLAPGDETYGEKGIKARVDEQVIVEGGVVQPPPMVEEDEGGAEGGRNSGGKKGRRKR